jgi:glutamine---fructose-6-phosphate transaminase (isomerizing)
LEEDANDEVARFGAALVGAVAVLVDLGSIWKRMRYIDAVRVQGKNLRASRKTVTGRLQSLDLALWRRRRLALVGRGASSNAISAALPGYWGAGLPAAGWVGSQFGLAGAAAGAEAVIAVSQTGKSAEVHAAPRDTGLPRLVVTDVADSPLAESDSAGDGAADLAAAAKTWNDAADGVDALVSAAEGFAAALLPRLHGVTAFDVLGSGVHAGTAMQGALLLREVCKLPVTGYETYQYLHGLVEAAAAGRVVIAIGGAREAKLATDLAAVGVTVVLIAAGDEAAGGPDGSPGALARSPSPPPSHWRRPCSPSFRCRPSRGYWRKTSACRTASSGTARTTRRSAR